MTGWGVVRALPAWLALLLAVPFPVSSAEDEGEKEIFLSGGETTSEEPFRPATAYWKVSLGVEIGPSEPGAWFRLALPISDGRQAILSREIAAEGFQTAEETGDANLFGVWTRPTTSEGGMVEVVVLAEVSEQRVEPPDLPYPPKKPPAEMEPYLAATEVIQSGHSEIRSRAREIVRAAKKLDEAAWALFQYTASFLKTDPEPEKLDALSVLRGQKGSHTGKARLLVAMLRAVGIPARTVGGLRLADASRTRATIAWVEAWLGDRWLPMDPGAGHFGYLPNNYLNLYRGDLPLIVHRTGLDVGYAVLVRQVTRKSVFESDKTGGRSVLKPVIMSDAGEEGDRVRTIASYLDDPVATVVILTDDEVPQAVIDRIRAEAKEDQINLVLLIARFQSRYFRESYLQQLASENLNAIRDAHVLLVSSRDEAGLYSLLGLGEGTLRLKDSRIVVTGSFLEPVGKVLGSVIYALFDPGELALFPEHTDVLKLWSIARANLIRGVPIPEEAQKWGIGANLIDEGSFEELSGYRQQIVSAWARAARAQVPLQALNLILVLPFIAFVVVIFRNFVGIETFGTFSPVIVSLAFLTTGLYWGVAIFVVIVSLGVLLRAALQRLRLHLVARLAILVGLVSAVMVGLTVVGAYLGIGALLQVSLFPMVIMSHLIENFTASQVEFGTRRAIRITANTLLVCALCYAAVEGSRIPSILLAFPEVLALVLLAEIAAGKWRGLRLLELKRFYDLLRRARGDGRPREAVR